MKAEHVIVPTLAIVAAWACIAFVLTGCGFLVRRGLLGRSWTATRIVTADMWLGLTAVIAYALVWNMWLPLDWEAWVLPLTAGLAGAFGGFRRLEKPSLRALSPWALGALGIGVLWFANRALGPPQDYDYGLYHLNLIAYAKHSAVIPGLANVQERLGAADPHLLFVALLDHGPLAGLGRHLVNGLLASMLILDLGSRFARRQAAATATPFTRTLALLLLPSVAVVAGFEPSVRVSSPNLDFSTFVLVAVAMVYLAECIETGFDIVSALTSTAVMALAAATRPLYWIAAVLALATVALAARSRSTRGRRLRAVAPTAALPVLLGATTLARQAILSGYPLLPLTFVHVPAGWRTPLSIIRSQNDWNTSWARWPGLAPYQVLGSWHWLSAYWLGHQLRNASVVVPLALLGAAVIALGLGLRGGAERARKNAPLLAVLVPTAVVLVVWFFTAPDPRFAWAPLWLLPASITAWALPDERRALPAFAVVIAAALGVLLAEVDRREPSKFLLVTLTGALLAAAALRLLRQQARAAAAGRVAAIAVVVAGGCIGGVESGAFHLIVADHAGALGTAPDTTPSLVSIKTDAGLALTQPANGGDQCWQALLCVPQLTSEELHLRGSTISDGFTDATTARSLTSP